MRSFFQGTLSQFWSLIVFFFYIILIGRILPLQFQSHFASRSTTMPLWPTETLIYLKNHIRYSMHVWTLLARQTVQPAAAPSDRLGQDHQDPRAGPPALILLVSIPSLASVLVSSYQMCLPTSSNVFSIWGQLFTSSGFFPSRKQQNKPEKHRTLSTLQVPFSPFLCCQRLAGLSPPGRQVMYLNTECRSVYVCLCDSTDVCV